MKEPRLTTAQKRALGYAKDMYPEANVFVQFHRGKPRLIAHEGDLIRLLSFSSDDPYQQAAS
jgi:hypothetical protein